MRNNSKVYLLPEGVQIAKLMYGIDAIVFSVSGPYIELHPDDAAALLELTHETVLSNVKSICDSISRSIKIQSKLS